MPRAQVTWLLSAALIAVAILFAALPASAQAPDDDEAVKRQPCFGAASIDPAQPCSNPALDNVVTPLPYAPSQADIKCDEKEYATALIVCGFGRPDYAAVETVALVGDSHAAHFRAAMRHVAERRSWRVFSLTHSSCPLQKATRRLAQPKRSSCSRFKKSVYRWFDRHPEIRTVFVSGLAGGSGVEPFKGMTRYESGVRGYVDAWESLPESVERIVVLHDTPKLRPHVQDCVQTAIDSGQPAGPTCKVLRTSAFDPDPMLEAAQLVTAPEVRVLDMTHYFCDPTYCYPVIGGALVLRDSNHMTGTYSATLGPYLQRELDKTLATFSNRWR